MTRDWRQALLVSGAPAVLVTVIASRGSTPREAGAWMLVDGERSVGSIGGGQLEFLEIARARLLLDQTCAPWHREVHRIVLGPDAGQCCGGVVEVLHEVVGSVERAVLGTIDSASAVVRAIDRGEPWLRADGPFHVDCRDEHAVLVTPFGPTKRLVVVYGGGHVAAALQSVLVDLPFVVRVLVDNATIAEPLHPTKACAAVICDDLVATARQQPAGAIHLVMTHSHDLDYAICDALLRRADMAFLGLIGSATKRARFIQRLSRAGHADASVARLVCPIGLAAVTGKDPAVIAVSVAAQLLSLN